MIYELKNILKEMVLSNPDNSPTFLYDESLIRMTGVTFGIRRTQLTISKLQMFVSSNCVCRTIFSAR
jgi:hypothetical protein